VRVRASTVGVVRGEPAKLHQVMVNLLLNAAEAGARGVELGAERDGREVRLSVSDDGEGIPPENLHRLFEPFLTTRAPGQGTGLGLATALRVIEQHGGRIEVLSEARRGTRFVCFLPG